MPNCCAGGDWRSRDEGPLSAELQHFRPPSQSPPDDLAVVQEQHGVADADGDGGA